MVTVPIARAPAPARASRSPSVQFIGTERLASVAPSTEGGFVTSYDWNPGLARTFSAGSRIGSSYNKYRIHARGNRIRYTPACSTLTTGSVYILIRYDPNDSTPVTQDEFADNQLTVTGPMYGPLTANIDRSQMGNSKTLIRTGPTPTDLLWTDACKIHIAAFGYGAASIGQTLGHFHIDYSADLMELQPLSVALPQPRNVFSTSIVEGTLPAGTAELILGATKYNTLGAQVEQGTAVRLPSGSYEVHTRLGVLVQASANLVFLSAELRVNTNRVDQSPAVYSDTPATNAQFSLVANNIITVSEQDLLEFVVVHDADSALQVIADRSLLQIKLL